MATRSPADPVSVLICSDGPIYREAGGLYLSSRSEIGAVGSCTEEDCTSRASSERPSVVLLVLSEFTTFARLIETVNSASKLAPVLVSAPRIPSALAREMMAAGASGLVAGQSGFQAVMDGILALAAGEQYICSRTAVKLASPDGHEPLTRREIDIVRLVALGYSNREAAQELFLSVRTVESHRAHASAKLGTTDRRALVSFALDQRLIP